VRKRSHSRERTATIGVYLSVRRNLRRRENEHVTAFACTPAGASVRGGSTGVGGLMVSPAKQKRNVTCERPRCINVFRDDDHRTRSLFSQRSDKQSIGAAVNPSHINPLRFGAYRNNLSQAGHSDAFRR